MIRYLIKNNMKLMSRSLINIIAFVVCPIIVSAVLTSAFAALMEKYEEADSFTVGYRITGEEQASKAEMLKTMGTENGIDFREYPAGDPEQILKDDDVACFIEFTDESYTVYEKENCKEQGKVLEGAMSLYYEYTVNPALMLSSQSATIAKVNADYIPPVDSKDYYGIIEIVYFGWCAIVCAAGLLTNEKKYRIRSRFRISGVSEVKLYLARLISLGTMVAAGVAMSALLNVLLFDVHWGNILLSAVIVLFMVMAASAFGLMLYSVTDSMVLTVIIAFSLVWIWGFFGGSFETYMFSSASETMKKLSPIYHENRALIEILLLGKSDYFISSIIYSLGICMGCSAVSVLAGRLRARCN